MRSASPSVPDPCLPFCEVLEQEYAAITGQPRPPPRGWEFTEDDILEPERLLRRVEFERNRLADNPASQRLRGIVDELLPARAATASASDPKPLQAHFTRQLNALLQNPQLYKPERFEGIVFRTHTQDRLGDPGDIRNRLLLEDAFPELRKVYDDRLCAVYALLRGRAMAALCLSGGGIRSATFALGVVQGLATKGLLDRFHYLSTVSGGGYLGGWLSAWIARTGLPNVVRQLSQTTAQPSQPEAVPIRHLRIYSNYLSPALAFLSADVWTMIATFLRNVFLIWLVLVPLLLGALMVPLVFQSLLSPLPWMGLWWSVLPVALVAAAAGVLAARYVHEHRPIQTGRTERTGLRDTKRDQRDFLTRCLTPLLVAGAGAVVSWAWVSSDQPVPLAGRPWLQLLIFAGIGGVVHGLGWGIARARKQRWEWLLILVAGVLGGAVAWTMTRLSGPEMFSSKGLLGLYATGAVPAILLIILVFSAFHVGLSSHGQVDAAREWSARYHAWVLIAAVAWLATFGLVLQGPIGLAALVDFARARLGEGGALTVEGVLGAIGALSGVVTLRLGHGADTSGRDAENPRARLALAIAAPVFLLFLVATLAWLAHRLVALVQAAFGADVPGLIVTGWVTAALVFTGLLMALRIDTNKFSLHAMYRARLIRAFLGASRPAGERDPNPFTGFDDDDNLSLRDLWPPPSPDAGTTRYQGTTRGGPLHVVNGALNLVGGKNLAWQERKAESFTFSPLHCGAYMVGYRSTRSSPDGKGYGGDHGISLGTAITISGAAASPNMGYHSSPIISFLLALFNVRLGTWLGNPGHAGRKVYELSSPRSSARPLLDEALGRTDDRNEYVYLSDGGHFDNLGLYEMVLRRCRLIVVSDAGCDPKCAFEDLGNAIRKIRVDLGIPIEFPGLPIHARDGDKPAPAGRYFAVGRILYEAVDPAERPGVLIYLKPAFYGDEPADVVNYARKCPAFPHESTSDQFFSESQFESYRALGFHVIDRVFPEPGPDGPEPLDQLLADLIGPQDTGPGGPASPRDSKPAEELQPVGAP